MHYIINVFTAPGESLEDAMAPFSEDLDPKNERGAWYGQRHWDWWVAGGRWDGYFDGENVTTAGELASGKVKGKFDVPYAFVTLSQVQECPNVSRIWHTKEIYVPMGFYEEQVGWRSRQGKWGLSYFLDAPNYEKHYNDYLRDVPADTLVHAVDVHS